MRFAERHCTFAILTALSPSAVQLGACLRSEAALVARRLGESGAWKGPLWQAEAINLIKREE